MFPGLAVLDELRARLDVDVAWIGATGGMERRIVREHGVDFVSIPAGKLRRYLSARNVADLFRVAAGVLRSISVIRRMRPAAIFSKGGFVSVPPVVAAGLLGVPVVSHESDVDPGLATRINARFTNTLCVAYEVTRGYFGAGERNARGLGRRGPRVVVTGNPLRPQILTGKRDQGLDALGFAPDDARPVVLFLGGSLGARQLNDLVAALRPRVADRWRIVHQFGRNDLPATRESDYVASPFFGAELPDVLAAADVVVCRAGASTLWEAAALARPMLLVPLVVGSRGDQLRNAALFARSGGAEVFTDPQTLVPGVVATLDRLATNPREREEMGWRARSVVRLDASAAIVSELGSILGG